MADRKISDLTALTTPASGDFLPIVDISEASAASKNKRITIEELMRGMPDGTAAAPSIAFESDEDTGVYSPGANQLAISTAGTGRLFVDASGNVGVGIAAPEGVFDVNRVADGAIGPILNIRNATATGSANTKGEIRFHQRDAVSNARHTAIGAGCGDTFSRDGYLYFATNSGTSAPTERMRLDSSGRLGLGTSAPSSLLHLADAGNITVGTTTGTKIGTATTQKLGFYNATPVVQPAAVADATDAASVITQLNALLAKLRTLGIIAT